KKLNQGMGDRAARGYLESRCRRQKRGTGAASNSGGVGGNQWGLSAPIAKFCDGAPGGGRNNARRLGSDQGSRVYRLQRPRFYQERLSKRRGDPQYRLTREYQSSFRYRGYISRKSERRQILQIVLGITQTPKARERRLGIVKPTDKAKGGVDTRGYH